MDRIERRHPVVAGRLVDLYATHAVAASDASGRAQLPHRTHLERMLQVLGEPSRAEEVFIVLRALRSVSCANLAILALCDSLTQHRDSRQTKVVSSGGAKTRLRCFENTAIMVITTLAT